MYTLRGYGGITQELADQQIKMSGTMNRLQEQDPGFHEYLENTPQENKQLAVVERIGELLKNEDHYQDLIGVLSRLSQHLEQNQQDNNSFGEEQSNRTTPRPGR